MTGVCIAALVFGFLLVLYGLVLVLFLTLEWMFWRESLRRYRRRGPRK